MPVTNIKNKSPASPNANKEYLITQANIPARIVFLKPYFLKKNGSNNINIISESCPKEAQDVEFSTFSSVKKGLIF